MNHGNTFFLQQDGCTIQFSLPCDTISEELFAKWIDWQRQTFSMVL